MGLNCTSIFCLARDVNILENTDRRQCGNSECWCGRRCAEVEGRWVGRHSSLPLFYFTDVPPTSFPSTDTPYPQNPSWLSLGISRLQICVQRERLIPCSTGLRRQKAVYDHRCSKIGLLDCSRIKCGLLGCRCCA
ncbi:uncharacterized protein EKO05_0004169 [Ascochyta rabiei]|uniref:uncharacterized protein n=1 Tax=Didymella rabiei TaxID=5454 RepID=UPI0021FB7D36|nr:uncharacterized protein EKO05_0004169 [Ascochyta rabiei]UPX13669.1 hypothetical protein EKO05_0004169 [Ascochyta rabiei]